jgi:hypothetical protein
VVGVECYGAGKRGGDESEDSGEMHLDLVRGYSASGMMGRYVPDTSEWCGSKSVLGRK